MGGLRQLGEVLRGLFLHNVLLKLLAVVIAAGLWFFVNAAERDSEAEFPVALRYDNEPTELMLVSPRIEEVALKVSGPSTLLSRIENEPLTINLDLRRVRPGATTIRLRANRLELPRGVSAMRMTPSEITLEFAKVERKRVPVQIVMDGRPAGDLSIAESRVSPDQVDISGPGRIVREIAVAKTQAVDLSEAKPGRLRVEAALDLEAEFLTVSAPTVNVEILLAEPVDKRKLGKVAVIVRNASGQANVKPSEIELQVSGARSKVKVLELPNGAVYVDAKELAVGVHRVHPQASLPAGIELVGELAEVKVTIEEMAPTPTPSAMATGVPTTQGTPLTPQADARVSEEVLSSRDRDNAG